jgi:hypothetical protein
MYDEDLNILENLKNCTFISVCDDLRNCKKCENKSLLRKFRKGKGYYSFEEILHRGNKKLIRNLKEMSNLSESTKNLLAEIEQKNSHIL